MLKINNNNNMNKYNFNFVKNHKCIKKIKDKNYLLIILLSALSQISYAQTTNNIYANFQTTASLVSSCTISTNNVTFGTINTNSTTDSNLPSLFTTNCTKGTTYSLALNGGQSGNIENRVMSGSLSTDKLAYQVYIDSSETNVWGDGTEGKTQTFTGSSLPINYTFYVKLLKNQYVTPDTYTDNLTVTLSY